MFRLLCLTVIALKSVDLAAAPPPPVQPVPEAALLALAQKKFGKLSRAEEELFRAAQEGRDASALAEDEKENDPAGAVSWNPGRVVRAKCISWICTDPQASALVTYRGLNFSGMRIDGSLDMANAEIKFQFLAWKCAFSDNILLQDAHMRGFYLLECKIKGVRANRAIITGSLLLQGLKTDGEINLLGATIGGDLDCFGAHFSHANGLALDANGAKIEGSVFFRGFKAEGEVNLVGARIGGNLECDGGQFLNAKGVALIANGAEIGGGVYLRDGFKADGGVDLGGAIIGGDLDCGRGQFSDAEGLALNAGAVKIERGVYLRDGFKAEGEVNLVGAAIGAALDCGGGQFSNAEGLALNASGVKIESGVYLRDGFNAQGEVNLLGATIGRSLDCQGGQFSKPGGLALNANSAKINGSVFLRGIANAEGEVTPFKAEGEVNFLTATIGGDLDCRGGQFSGPPPAAPTLKAPPVLDAEGARIEGNVYLRDGFRAQGGVRLVGATMRTLQIFRVKEAEQTIFDLGLAKVETFWDEEKSWPTAGNLILDGFRYDRLYDTRKRKNWLGLQPRKEFRPQPYEQLAGVLRQMGHEREARQVMIWKNQERAEKTHIFEEGWLWYKVFGPFIKYGYAPSRAFWGSLAMIVLGFFLFRRGFRHGLITPTSDSACEKGANGEPILDEKGRPKISEKYPVFNAFVYSFESFVPLLKLDQSANWRPNANRGAKIPLFFRFWAPQSGSLLRGYLYFHIAAGWLLTSLWVGAVTGLVKT